MAANSATGSGTREDPWVLRTPSGSSEYQMYRDEAADPPVIVCVVGKTTLGYQLRGIEDLHAMLKERGDWVPLGSADEQKPAAAGTVEAWARSADNPGRRLVRHQEGPARAFRHVHAAAARSARLGRGRAQRAQQPHAGAVASARPRSRKTRAMATQRTGCGSRAGGYTPHDTPLPGRFQCLTESTSPQGFLYPMPMTLIGADLPGGPNFMPVAWINRVQYNPPRVAAGMGKTHSTNAGIREYGEFSVNIPSVDMVAVTDWCGIKSAGERRRQGCRVRSGPRFPRACTDDRRVSDLA